MQRENAMYQRNYNSGNIFENLVLTLGRDILRWFLPIDLTSETKKSRMETDCNSWDMPPWKRYPKTFGFISLKLKCKRWNYICCILCRKFNCGKNIQQCCLFDNDCRESQKKCKSCSNVEEKPMLPARSNMEIVSRSDSKTQSDTSSSDEMNIPTA